MKNNAVILVIILLIVAALLTLNGFFQQSLQIEMAEQFNRHQLILAQAEAENIQAYISRSRDELLRTAQFTSRFPVRTEGEYELVANSLRRDSRQVRKGIKFLDRNGSLQYGQWHTDAGSDDTNRDLVEAARSLCPGGVVIRQNEKRVLFIAPVCRSGIFDGVVAMFYDTQDIARSFLGSIKSGVRGYAWMMDGKGSLLFHPAQPDMVGRNLYKTDSSCFTCHKSFEVEKKIIEGTGDPYGRHVAPTGEDKVLAFSTASVGDARWIVVVSAPYSEVTTSIKTSMRFHTWLILFILLTTGVGTVLLINANRKRIKAEESIKHQKELERYAAELEDKVAARTRELSVEKEKLNTIVTAMGSGIMLLDAQGKILWINRTMQDIAGKDITGMTAGELLADSHVISSHTVNGLETALMTNLFGTSERTFQIITAPVKNESGTEGASIRLVHDVTEMKKMEMQMMHAEKLASLERLTSGIANEIGNPLTSVLSFVEVLLDREDDELKRETLETIDLHMNRIADILEGLSGFSKVQPLELRPCRLGSIIEEALSLIQYDKRVQEITIVRDLPPDLPEIRTDRSQLAQVIVNIVLNAADAMPSGGTLTIQGRRQNNTLAVSFKDTGVGIDKEHIGRIFDPFYTTKKQGTGLGLAVSYGIIKKLNGELSVESEPGKGSRFTITLLLNGKA